MAKMRRIRCTVTCKIGHEFSASYPSNIAGMGYYKLDNYPLPMRKECPICGSTLRIKPPPVTGSDETVKM